MWTHIVHDGHVEHGFLYRDTRRRNVSSGVLQNSPRPLCVSRLNTSNEDYALTPYLLILRFKLCSVLYVKGS
jgi:hypothetical protein